MKCPNCGCEDFYIDRLRTGSGCVEGGAWEPIEINGCQVVTYLCKKCGRVELYGPDSLAKYQAQEKERIEKEQKQLEAEKRKSNLLKEKARLEAIAEDENQTVKAVRKANERLEKINEELKNGPRGNY